MVKIRKICVVTGTRADYGLLKPILHAIESEPLLWLSLIVTGMHLDPRFGMSVTEIETDGFHIDAKININSQSDDGLGISLSIAKAIEGISKIFQEINPDLVLLLGDRSEILAAAIAAAYQNIFIGHIHGGDKSKGGLDESTRHAITKFAHLHFPATEKSGERIIKLGENPKQVFVCGAPGLDTILHSKLLSKTELETELGFNLAAEFILVVQHSVSTEPEKSLSQIEETLAALSEINKQVLLIYPNSDSGGLAMITRIEAEKNILNFHRFKTLPHVVYLSLLRDCSALIGNSSSGMIESASFKIPVVNIGMRQEGREHSENVINVPNDRKAIMAAYKKVQSAEFKAVLQNLHNPYGDGNAAAKIAGILANFEFDKSLIQKQISY